MSSFAIWWEMTGKFIQTSHCHVENDKGTRIMAEAAFEAALGCGAEEIARLKENLRIAEEAVEEDNMDLDSIFANELA